MKKIFIILVSMVLITGCNTSKNTPTNMVEELLSKYQNLDGNVVEKLEKIVSSNENLNENQKKDYIKLMKRQYQNMAFKILNEDTKDDSSNIFVEIEVYDYKNALDNSEKYFQNNKDKFLNENNKIDKEKYMDYKIDEMKKIDDRKKYNFTVTLTKINNMWIVDNLSDSDIEKIHGIH